MPMPGDQYRDTPATTNPFLPPQQRISEYTAQEIATLQSRLHKQLGPEYISTRQGPGGGRVHYLAAEKVINLANEVFGFNGWSSAIQNVQVDFVDEDPRNGDITLGLSTIVRVTLRDGTYHEDIGYGQMKNCKGKAAAFEKAKKEAATDALKRALRNFGNVLGNCLYDKDYLQKVTKLKVAPSRWDADNLHRHRDFAPIKKESIQDVEAQREKDIESRRQTSNQSLASAGSMEFDDDFGGNLFDESDFPQSDEIRLDATPAKLAPANGVQTGPSVARSTSMPQMRPTNGTSPASAAPASVMQPPQRPQVQLRPPNGTTHVQNSRAQPQANIAQQKPMAQAHIPSDVLGSRSNPTTAPDAEVFPPEVQQQQATAGQSDEPAFSAPRLPPPGVPQGFVTGRVADLVNQVPGVRPANVPIPQFDPTADSPSIRRTSGINPGRSAPVTRSSLGGGGGNDAANMVAGPGNGMNGSTTPVRANFVNPAADPNRRIGMPPGAMPGRTAYKPPGAVKRPPLSDVSNLQQADGGSDGKKPRVDSSQGGPPAPAG